MSNAIASGLRRLVRALRGRTLAFALIGTAVVLSIMYYLTSLNLFVIRDGDTLTLFETYTQDAQDALREAGVTISRYDSVSLPAEPLRGGAAEVVIRRSQTVTVLFDGREIRMSTYGEDVNTVLERADVTLGARDIVEPAMGSPTYDGMVVRVTRRDVRAEQTAEPIDFEVLREETKAHTVGYEKCSQEGSPGERVTFYEVLLEEGVEISRRVTGSVVTVDPVNEEWIIGTAPKKPKPVFTPVVLQELNPGMLTMPDGTEISYSRMLDVTATAYTTEGRSHKTNASGKVARVGTIAVDPKVIPLRSKVYIEAADGSWVYGIAVCEDTGGAIKGNIIDLFFDTYSECIKFGRKKAKIYVLE